MINCPNPTCRAANPEGSKRCQVCQSALPHRYLWGVGDWAASLKSGDLFNRRYLLKSDRIFLDTQPGLVPESLPELPDFLMPYLHLSAYPLHTPRPYAVMPSSDKESGKNYVLMLESSALSESGAELGAASDYSAQSPSLLPELSASWADAPPLRQLSWLWQIACLWDAFDAEQVASTLLNGSFLRVDGSVLRLLELASPPTGHALPQRTAQLGSSAGASKQPTLMDLSRSWQPLVKGADPAVRAFLDRLCEGLDRQQLNAEQLSEQLSQAVSVCAQGQAVSYDLAMYTDQGPTRKRNEDACYPASGTLKRLTGRQTRAASQLLIVCDGIGGHQGGDVASKLAIATIESRLQPLVRADRGELSATEISLAIEAAICAANDEISAQNDQAQRQARDRMGTTLVLALVRGADVYIAHLGDSRAYRISAHNCQQVTLDDDVASRQVRMGGSLYREVLLQPGSGSLIQALGMSSSQTLRPTVQRFVMDEDCVFLLCSDGLSDSDRVEQFWQQTLRPLVVEEKSTAKVAKELIDLANKYNGHDNVTVGLLTAKVVRASDRIVPRELASEIIGETALRTTGAAGASNRGGTSSRANRGATRITQMRSAGETIDPSSKASTRIQDAPAADNAATARTKLGAPISTTPKSPLKIGAVLLLLAALGGALYVLFSNSFGLQLASSGRDSAGRGDVVSSTAEPSSAIDPSASGQNSDQKRAGTLPPADIKVGAYLRIRQSDFPGIVGSAPNEPVGSNAETSQLLLYPNPTLAERVIPGTIPTGGIVRIVEQATADKTAWVRLKLCSIPSGTSLSDAPAETDLPASKNPLSPGNVAVPESVAGKSMMLSPNDQGWALIPNVAAVAETVKGLQPSQQGTCGS